MPTVDYPFSVPYQPGTGGALAPLLTVELIWGQNTTRAAGILDSGSTITVFNPQHAELLGIENVQEGELTTVLTQGGEIEYYVFDLEMQIQLDGHTTRFPCRVGFFPTRRPRNILGRNYIFTYYQIGSTDSGQVFYLRPEL